MGTVIDFRSKQKYARPTDTQRIMMLKKALRVAVKYIDYAQDKKAYDGFEIDGIELNDFLQSLDDI